MTKKNSATGSQIHMPIDKATVFTTGTVAKICGVTMRTVAKWADNGLLPSYRLPSCNDRRIPRDELISFLKKVGFPIPLELDGKNRLLVASWAGSLVHKMRELLPEWEIREAWSPTSTIMIITRNWPTAVLLGGQMPISDSDELLHLLCEFKYPPSVFFLPQEDRTDVDKEKFPSFVYAVLDKCSSPEGIAVLLTNYLAKRRNGTYQYKHLNYAPASTKRRRKKDGEVTRGSGEPDDE